MVNEQHNSNNMKHIQDNVKAEFDPVYDKNIEELITKQATSALLLLLLYSILMFTLPFGAFFSTQYLLRNYTDLSEFAITSLSVTSAVIMVYIIIALYAYHAYNERDIIIPGESKCKKERADKKLN